MMMVTENSESIGQSADRKPKGAPGLQRNRILRVGVQCGIVLAMGFMLSACDKCGRSTPINKPWSLAACDSGPSTR